MTPVLWVVGLLGVVSLIYLLASGGYWFLGGPGMVLAFIGYVVANLGLIWDAIQMGKH